MTLPELETAIQRQVTLVLSARGAEAIEGGMMFDSIAFGRVTFFRPTLAHVWLLLVLERGRAWRSESERRMVIGYTLTVPPEQVRNRLYREFAVDPENFRCSALAFFKGRVEALAVVETLLEDLKPTGAESDEEPLKPGWWARCVDKLAAHYHWSEEAIFALPLVRFAAYGREIDGSDRLPDTVLLPEERELKRLQQLRLEMKRNGRNQKPADPDSRGE